MESTSIEVEFRKSSFPLSDLQVYQFGLYLKQLKAWNSYINLTSIDDDLGIIHKHFLDSLKLLKFIELPLACRLIDIGSGAGFPGLPLKIYQPSTNLLLVESVSKKASFLQFVLAQFRQTAPHGFGQFEVLANRAETLAAQEKYLAYVPADVVVTRYVADISDSATYCLPLLQPNGTWYAYKSGPKKLVEKEIDSAQSVLSQLGAEVVDIYEENLIAIKRGQ